MVQLEQWGMPLAVVGMLLLMLFMASALNRYQAHQTRVQAAVRRLEAGVNAVTGALSGGVELVEPARDCVLRDRQPLRVRRESAGRIAEQVSRELVENDDQR